MLWFHHGDDLEQSHSFWIARLDSPVVCCAAQEASTPHHEYIDRKLKKNVIFTAM